MLLRSSLKAEKRHNLNPVDSRVNRALRYLRFWDFQLQISLSQHRGVVASKIYKLISGVFLGGFPVKVAANWSGGKDCCLSLYNTVMQGYEVSELLNFAFMDFASGRWNPVSFSHVFKYMITDNSSRSIKNTAHKVSMLSSLALREVVKRAPNQLTVPVKNMLETVGGHRSNEVTNIIGAVRINARQKDGAA